MTVRQAKTRISLGIRQVWSETSLSAWRSTGPLATHRAHSKDSDQTGQMPRLIWVFDRSLRSIVGFVMLRLILLLFDFHLPPFYIIYFHYLTFPAHDNFYIINFATGLFFVFIIPQKSKAGLFYIHFSQKIKPHINQWLVRFFLLLYPVGEKKHSWSSYCSLYLLSKSKVLFDNKWQWSTINLCHFDSGDFCICLYFHARKLSSRAACSLDQKAI